jgi:hypothetical protein
MKVRPINFEDLKAALRQVKASVSSQVHHFYVCVSVLRIRIRRIRMYRIWIRIRINGSGSGFFYHQAKIGKKNLDSYCFVTSL